MSTLTFDPTAFRALFPAFADPTAYPDALLTAYWDIAINYISPIDGYGWMQGAARQLALNYMTAHLLAINGIIANGQTPNIVNSATVDKVSVGLTPPPLPNQWQFWLGTTPYGQQLLALLQVFSVGGFYAGSLPELAAFRRVGGVFI
jgi:ABC-type dipeptide/oligopeptide/nickel transport system permease subunit